MAENSKIEWTDHTTNLWWGCQKVNPACDNCYAETLSRRYDGEGESGESIIWGPRSKRRPIKSWLSNLDKYQRKAEKAGERHRVFVGSMMDIFEISKPLTEEWENKYEKGTSWLFHTGGLRDHFFFLLNSGRWPDLIFLLLTKRPGNIPKMVPPSWLANCPENVWFGTSIPNQEVADRDIPKLLSAPGRKNKFLSIEPLLGPVNLEKCSCLCGWVGQDTIYEPEIPGMFEGGDVCPKCRSEMSWKDWLDYIDGISWVIVGGESGPNARPMHPDWVEFLRDQCKDVNAPFFFKQWGEYAPRHDLQARNLPGKLWHIFDPDTSVCKVGKKEAGRLLGGREYSELPAAFLMNSNH